MDRFRSGIGRGQASDASVEDAEWSSTQQKIARLSSMAEAARLGGKGEATRHPSSGTFRSGRGEASVTSGGGAAAEWHTTSTRHEVSEARLRVEDSKLRKEDALFTLKQFGAAASLPRPQTARPRIENVDLHLKTSSAFPVGQPQLPRTQAPLPIGWIAQTDAFGRVFYSHSASGHTSWERPSVHPPQVSTPPRHVAFSSHSHPFSGSPHLQAPRHNVGSLASVPHAAGPAASPAVVPHPHGSLRTLTPRGVPFFVSPSGQSQWEPPGQVSQPLATQGCDARRSRSDGGQAASVVPSNGGVHQRSSLVVQEPLRIINPVQKFFRGLHPPGKAMTLAKSLGPVIQAIESGQITNLDVRDLQMAIDRCHRNGLDEKRFKEGKNPTRLTAAGIASINLYTGEFGNPPFYSVLNTTLRDSNRQRLQPFVQYIWLLMHALRDCTRYEMRVVFRGVKGVDLSSEYPKHREVTWYQFSSCTCDLSVEQSDQFCGNFGVRTLFTIELTTGRARVIDKYSLEPSEAEVLLPPNSRFRVKGFLKAGNGLTQIQLEELPCLEPILDFDVSATMAAPVAPQVSASVSGGRVAVVSGAPAEDPEILAFARSLRSLSVGTAEVCLKFAKALGALGILSVDKLKTIPVTQAKSYLKRVQMTDVQIDSVMTVIGAHAYAAAAAARIVGKPDILEAARDGNVALVKDHILADPVCVNKRSERLISLQKITCTNVTFFLQSNDSINEIRLQ
jgi:hypothetical protein